MSDSLLSLVALVGQASFETVIMVLVSALFASTAGLGLGLALLVTERNGLLPSPRLHRALEAAVNVGRSVPFVILMVAITPFTRLVAGTSIGTRAAIVPLVVAAIPYVARLVESACKQVDPVVVEAVTAMGATPLQVVRYAYLGEALPALIRGFTVAVVSLVSYSAMAGAVGGGGLGDLAVRYGYQRFRTDVMLVTVAVLVVLVQGIQFAGERLARRFDHR